MCIRDSNGHFVVVVFAVRNLEGIAMRLRLRMGAVSYTHLDVYKRQVGVGVFQIAAGQQRAGLFKHGDDDGIGGPDFQAFESGWDGAIPCSRIHVDVTRIVDAAGGIQAVALAGGEVVRAVSGCGVDGAGTLIGGDVSGQHAQYAAVKEWRCV